MHLTFANMHKTLPCERLGCPGLDWVGLGCFWFCFWGVGFFIGLGWVRMALVWDGVMLLDTPAVQLNLHAASYSNGLGGVREALTIK